MPQFFDKQIHYGVEFSAKRSTWHYLGDLPFLGFFSAVHRFVHRYFGCRKSFLASTTFVPLATITDSSVRKNLLRHQILVEQRNPVLCQKTWIIESGKSGF